MVYPVYRKLETVEDVIEYMLFSALMLTKAFREKMARNEGGVVTTIRTLVKTALQVWRSNKICSVRIDVLDKIEEAARERRKEFNEIIRRRLDRLIQDVERFKREYKLACRYPGVT